MPSDPRLTLPRPLALPDFPWDSLKLVRALAAAHPDGVVDLAIGTPVDDSPDIARTALVAASNAPGYPATVGTSAVREAIIAWMERRRGVRGLTDDSVIPTIGSKESVALLPLQLGAGPGDVIVHPRAAYPTYDVGARLAGATPVPVDTDADPDTWELPAGPDGAPAAPVIVWLNSPGNPDGTSWAWSSWRASSPGRGAAGPSSSPTSATPSSAGPSRGPPRACRACWIRV